jgi:hypothetical protein
MYQRPSADQEPRQQQDAPGVTTPGETTPVTRRRALPDGTAALLAGGAIAATATLGTATDAFAAAAKKDKPKSRGSAKATTISVNGAKVAVHSTPGTMLLYVLRDELHLRGPKFGCGLSVTAAWRAGARSVDARG